MSNWVWSACHVAFGRSARCTWISSYRSRKAASPSWASGRVAGSSLPTNTYIRTLFASESGRAALPHPGDPAPGGAKWNAGGGGHLRQQGLAVDIGTQQREALRSTRLAILCLAHDPPVRKRIVQRTEFPSQLDESESLDLPGSCSSHLNGTIFLALKEPLTLQIPA